VGHRGYVLRIVRGCTLGCVAVVTGLGLAIAGHYFHEVREAKRDAPEVVAKAYGKHGDEVRLEAFSAEREKILIMVQDPAFRHHRGVDLVTPGAGMTTLTQSLVKQLYFPEGFRQGIAKVRQTLIAQHALDAQVSKDEQLELFLNIAYLGHHEGEAVHGFGMAARVYFGKQLGDLSEGEYLALVAALINPNSLKPGSLANEERIERIQRYLRGEYRPVAVMDLEYRGEAADLSFSARKLVTFLRLITDARPTQAERVSRAPDVG
jgi:membrane carboxypeptidase/penicillin-binding protein PbpC